LISDVAHYDDHSSAQKCSQCFGCSHKGFG
jgi:hypothetical protein